MVTIEAKNISLEFEGKQILKDINLKVNPHETLVLIGPSGSGKTVLLKLLAGILSPTNGKILIDGEDWKNLESENKHSLAKKIGVLFQQGALFDTMSALDNVEFPLQEHTELEGEELHEYAKELLDMVNLLDAANKLPGQLSGGMQKRLGIARALALHPELIFYDDPVAGQDPMQSDQMLKLINTFKEKYDATVIMVTSNMKVAYRMASRIVMVIDDEIIVTGTPEQTKNHPDPRVQQFINGTLDGPISIA